jgi:hypothetical protein
MLCKLLVLIISQLANVMQASGFIAITWQLMSLINMTYFHHLLSKIASDV